MAALKVTPKECEALIEVLGWALAHGAKGQLLEDLTARFKRALGDRYDLQ